MLKTFLVVWFVPKIGIRCLTKNHWIPWQRTQNNNPPTPMEFHLGKRKKEKPQRKCGRVSVWLVGGEGKERISYTSQKLKMFYTPQCSTVPLIVSIDQ
jgi:hypothetical protein